MRVELENGYVTVSAERLDKLVEELKKTHFALIDVEKDMCQLKRENHRLREALEVLKEHCQCCSVQEGYQCDCSARMARAALGGGE